MIISFKSLIKLTGIVIVCFCAVFVCTFFLNFYIDVLPLRDSVSEQMLPLYEAQLATAQMCCSITGGVLALTVVVMIVFYVRLYIGEHAAELGILKSMGYSAERLALNFLFFGLSALSGCLLGYAAGHAAMPFVYGQLTIEGLNVEIRYHVSLLFALVLAPALLFSALSCVCAYLTLRKPALAIMKGEKEIRKQKLRPIKRRNRSFLREIAIRSIGSNKLLTFFVAFSGFCFSAMVQMSASMESLVSGTMGWMILAIGLVLSVTSVFMALTALIKNVSKSVAMMKTFGYPLAQCTFAVFAGFVPFLLLGFALGTVYQFGLLSFMVNLIFERSAKFPFTPFEQTSCFTRLLHLSSAMRQSVRNTSVRSIGSPLKPSCLKHRDNKEDCIGVLRLGQEEKFRREIR